MLIYEVNIEVDESINYKVAGWLPEHIDNVLKTPGFQSAYWFFRQPEDEDRAGEKKTLWTVHYVVDSRASLDAYIIGRAVELRKEAVDKFGEQMKTTRRILNLLGMAQSPNIEHIESVPTSKS